jgi:hypothetical protein
VLHQQDRLEITTQELQEVQVEILLEQHKVIEVDKEVLYHNVQVVLLKEKLQTLEAEALELEANI